MRGVAKWLAIAAIIVGAACGAEDDAVAPPTEESIVGVYRLTIVNGGPLPFPVQGSEVSILSLTGGRLTLRADHSFTDSLSYVLTYSSGSPPPTVIPDVTNGTFTLNGTTLELTYPGQGVTAVAVTADLLHLNNGGLTFTYSK